MDLTFPCVYCRLITAPCSHCIYILRGHIATIRCARVLHNRPIAVTGSRDTTVRVWDIQKGRMLRILQGHSNSVRCLDVCGNKVVSGSYDASCRVRPLQLSVYFDGRSVADMERRHRGVSTRPQWPRARNLFGCIRWRSRCFRRNGYNCPCMGRHVRVSPSL
jgi:WD40 repeat protein